MRIGLVLLPLATFAAPAFAQRAPTPQLPPELVDPGTTEKLVDMLQTLSTTMLDLPVGEVRAAAEGREPTAADRKATVRSETGLSERQLRAQMAAAKPMIARSMKAMTTLLPQLMDRLEGMEGTLERATANLPDPTYPKR